MSDKVGRYAKVARRYRVTQRLEGQGAQAAGGHGFQIHGTCGQRLPQARSGLGHSCAAPAKGRCRTSLPAAGQGPGVRPPALCAE
eukprot:3530410-Pyramimonas_sp.AAC.1